MSELIQNCSNFKLLNIKVYQQLLLNVSSQLLLVITLGFSFLLRYNLELLVMQ